MRTSFRLLALVASAVAALALAGGALAVPKLIISSAPAAPTVVQVTEEKTDAAPLMIRIYIPKEFTASLTQPAGTQIGTVHADLQALAISPDAIINADGQVLTDTPAKFVANTCAPGVHPAVLVLHVTVSGQTIDVPVYVDAPLSGAEAALGAAKLTLCLSNPYEQAAPGTRAPFGVKIINAKMSLDAGVISPPASGESHWTSLITPWTINGATPNAAGTVEARAIVRVPATLTLGAKVKTKKKGRKVANSVLLSGKLLEALQGVQGGSVTILAGGKSIGTAKTSSTGAFSKSLGLKKKTTFQARAVVPQRDVTAAGCAGASAAPGGCVSATLAGYTLTSNRFTAVPKKK